MKEKRGRGCVTAWKEDASASICAEGERLDISSGFLRGEGRALAMARIK